MYLGDRSVASSVTGAKTAKALKVYGKEGAKEERKLDRIAAEA